MDSGYIRVNTFSGSVSPCLQSEVPGRVSSGLSLFIPVFARIIARVTPAGPVLQLSQWQKDRGLGVSFA